MLSQKSFYLRKVINPIISLSQNLIKNRKDNKAQTPELLYSYGTYGERSMTQLTRNKGGGEGKHSEHVSITELQTAFKEVNTSRGQQELKVFDVHTCLGFKKNKCLMDLKG